MASESLRREVLRAFKNLHRARCRVFQDDIEALTAARNKINEEYRKNLTVTNPDAIKELVKNSNEATEELLTCVVQLRLVDENQLKYRLMMRPEVKTFKNHPYPTCSQN